MCLENPFSHLFLTREKNRIPNLFLSIIAKRGHEESLYINNPTNNPVDSYLLVYGKDVKLSIDTREPPEGSVFILHRSG